MTDKATEDILKMISIHYEQILYCNLTKNVFSVLWSNDNTISRSEATSQKASLLVNKLLMQSYIHADDLKIISSYIDISNVKKLLEVDEFIKFRFRQRRDRISEDYSWTEIEIIKSSDYAEDNIALTLFIRDINSEYAQAYKRHRTTEKLAVTDILTGVGNRYSFEKHLATFTNDTCTGVVYLDLNRLKHINDTEGHQAGDVYIIHFAGLLTACFGAKNCYRVGGDEFVVIISNIDESQFNERLSLFSELNIDASTGVPIAAIGHMWSEPNEHELNNMIATSEDMMYNNKKDIQQKFGYSR